MKQCKKCLSMICAALLLFSMQGTAAAAQKLELTAQTPASGSQICANDEISLMFNQTVEISVSGMPDVLLMEDQDKDGTGDHILPESQMGYFSDVLEISSENPNKVLVNINEYLQEEMQYVLIISPNICAADGGERFEGIGDLATQAGWIITVTSEADPETPNDDSDTGEPDDSAENPEDDQKTDDEPSKDEPENEKKDDSSKDQEKDTPSQVQPGEGDEMQSVNELTMSVQDSIILLIEQAMQGDVIDYTIKDDMQVTAAMLDALKKKEEVTLLFNATDYSISVNSDDLTVDYNEDFVFPLSLAFDPKAQLLAAELSAYEEHETDLGVVLSFDGEFPGVFDLMIRKQTELSEKDDLYLYYYDESNDLLVQEGDVVCKDGTVTCSLTHGSYYLLSETRLGGTISVKTALIAVFTLAAIITLAVGSMHTLRRKRK